MPAPAIFVQAVGYFLRVIAGALAPPCAWNGRVQVDGDIEAVTLGEDGPEERIVIETALVVIVHQCPYEPK